MNDFARGAAGNAGPVSAGTRILELPIAITLEKDEIHTGMIHGAWRRLQNLFASGRGDFTATDNAKYNQWTIQIESACAELAVCKLLGVYWQGLSESGAVDAGRYEVRWTIWEGTGGLPIKRRDNNDAIFLLMDGRDGRYHLVGWMKGNEAKWDDFATETWVDYLVPRKDLHKRLEIPR